MKNKKLLVIIGIVLVLLILGGIAFINSDYWQSIKDSSASGVACKKYTTQCTKNSKGVLECKKVCITPANNPAVDYINGVRNGN